MYSPVKIFSSTPVKYFWKYIREPQNFRSNKTQISVMFPSTDFIFLEFGLGCLSDPLHPNDIPIVCSLAVLSTLSDVWLM